MAKRVILVVFTAGWLALILLHVDGVNGPPYWRWEWQRIAWWRVYPLLAAPMVAFGAAQVTYRKGRVGVALGLLMVCVLGLELLAVGLQKSPFDLGRAREIVTNHVATSYHTDAARIVRRGIPAGEFVAKYPTFLPRLSLHSREKPPGPVLFYWGLVRLTGSEDRAADLGAGIIALLATACVPATWWLVRVLTGDAAAAFCGASFLALCPGLVVFFPMLDQVYPVLACGMVVSWVMALERNSYAWAAAYGVVLALATFTAYNMLVVGVFLPGYALLRVAGKIGEGRVSGQVVVRQAVTALAVVGVFYAVLWAATGFDPVATFRAAVENQDRNLAKMSAEKQRRWPGTVPWDLADFALGAGWVGVVLAVCFWIGSREARLKWLVGLCVVQVLVVALTGLLQTETARVWAFMLPLWMVPVGLELARWTWRGRAVAYACTWLLLAAAVQNMIFVTTPAMKPGAGENRATN